MRNTLKSEFRKVITIRSAYVVALIVLILVGVVAVASLYQLRATNTIDSSVLEQAIYAGITIASQLAAIFAILIMGHEYRYNLIFHTLTANRSKSFILVSKMLVSVAYALVVSFLAAMTAYITAKVTLGLIVKFPPQQVIDFASIIPTWFVYSSAYALIGLLLALLFRTIVAPIVIIILVPSTIEPILSILLDENQKYLPFTSLQMLALPGGESDILQSTATITAYLFVGWAYGWYLFNKRDAAQQ